MFELTWVFMLLCENARNWVWKSFQFCHCSTDSTIKCRANVQLILCYKVGRIFWSKVFYTCVDNPTKFRDWLQNKTGIRGTLVYCTQHCCTREKNCTQKFSPKAFFACVDSGHAWVSSPFREIWGAAAWMLPTFLPCGLCFRAYILCCDSGVLCEF